MKTVMKALIINALKLQSLLALIPTLKDRYAVCSRDKIMQYAAEVKLLKIEMKSSENLQRKHGLKTSTKFYLEERENILQDHTLRTHPFLHLGDFFI